MGRENGQAGKDAANASARTHADALRLVQNRVLELAIRDTSLEETLEALISAVEAQSADGLLGSILLLDKSGKHLRHGAAPSLPEAYNAAIDGIAIGPNVGSCGTAAHGRKPVYVSDIAEDPLWVDFRKLALAHGLRACWSTPILTGAGDVLGTFAMYYREPRKPSEDDLELVDFVTRSAALIIENKQGQEALREESRRLETLNRTAADIAAELDLERLVQRVTDAGVELTGADFGAFFYNVLDDEGESYMLYTLSGAERSDFEGYPMPRNTEVFAPTFEGTGVVRSGDITRDPRYGKNAPRKGMPEGHLPVASYLAVPVIGRSGEVIGGLLFGHKEVDCFTEAHERLMVGIAAQAATGIDNARLWQAAQTEIAERTRAEAALRESEARLRLALKASALGAWELDLESGAAVRSERHDQIFGYDPPRPDWSYEIFLEHVLDEDRDRVEAAFGTAIEHKASWEFECRIRRADGELRWIEARGEPARGEAGEDTRLIGIVADVTERKRAEQALRESEARFRRIADSAPTPMWVTRPDRKREFVNRAYIDFLDISYEEAVDFDWRGIIHPDDVERIVAESIEGEASLETFALEGRYRRGDGEWRWLRSVSQPRFNAAGEPNGFIGVAHDITDVKKADVALRESEERFRTVFEQASIGMIEIDSDWNILASNQAYREIAGRSANALKGANCLSFTHGDDIAVSEEALRDLAEGKIAKCSFEKRYLQPDGTTVWVRSNLSRVSERGETDRFLKIVEDITEVRNAREALRELNETLEQRVSERTAELVKAQEALRQSQKLEAMGQLTGGVAHDFNNLLSPIIGGLDMVQRRGVGDERARRQIDGALQSAERAKTLVQRLLAFARRQPLQAKAVDLGELVQGMVDLIDSTLGPSIEVRVDLAEDCPPARADANQIEMALLNLAVNARDAMPEGGELAIETTCGSVDGGEKAGLAAGDYVCLRVADTGCGMDEETRLRAIEPFFSTKGVGRGTGLGLSMVHGLAAQLGGGIHIESAPGEGTAVELWLPVSDQAIESKEPMSQAPSPFKSAGKALLVDDEILVRMGTADMLDELGYEVAEANSAEEALRILKEDGFEPDVLITDHLMPGMNGAELAREVRADRPGLPVLLISGYAEVEGLEPDIARLTKPFRNSELAECLATLMPGDGA